MVNHPYCLITNNHCEFSLSFRHQEDTAISLNNDETTPVIQRKAMIGYEEPTADFIDDYQEPKVLNVLTNQNVIAKQESLDSYQSAEAAPSVGSNRKPSSSRFCFPREAAFFEGNQN